MPRIMREHLRDKCSGGIGRDAATGSSKGAVLFFSGRMQGDEREDSGSGIRRHLPPEAVRTGEFGDTCLRTQPASGIRRMTECRKPVRMDRYEATGPSVRAGTGGPASARQLPGERSGGRSGGWGGGVAPGGGGGGRGGAGAGGPPPAGRLPGEGRGGRPVVGGSHTTGSCGCPAGNLQMLPRKVQRPGRCRRLFAETGIRYPRRGRTTPLPETNPAPSETLPAEAECRRQGWRTGGPLARGFCPNQEILQSRRSSMP